MFFKRTPQNLRKERLNPNIPDINENLPSIVDNLKQRGSKVNKLILSLEFQIDLFSHAKIVYISEKIIFSFSSDNFDLHF